MLKKSYIALLGLCVGLTCSSLAEAYPRHYDGSMTPVASSRSGLSGFTCMPIKYATESDMRQTLGSLKEGGHGHAHPHPHRHTHDDRGFDDDMNFFADDDETSEDMDFEEEQRLRSKLFPNLDAKGRHIRPKVMKVDHHTKGAIKRYEAKGGLHARDSKYVRDKRGEFDRYFLQKSHLASSVADKIDKSLRKNKTQQMKAKPKVMKPKPMPKVEEFNDFDDDMSYREPPMKKLDIEPIEQKPIPMLKESKPVVKSSPKPREVAKKSYSAPKTATSANFAKTTSLPYSEGETAISGNNETSLKRVVVQMQDNPNLRVKVKSFAHSDDGAVNLTRRISLQRAIKVRKYLIDNGVSATRVNVHAVGNASNKHNKVDLILEDN